MNLATFEVVAIALSVVGSLAIALYATWLFGHRIRAGEPAVKSFGQWLKHLFEAIWGL